MGDVGFVERSHHLRIDDDPAVDNEIRNQLPDEVTPVVDWKLPLLLDGVPSRNQLDDECVLVRFSSNPGFQFV